MRICRAIHAAALWTLGTVAVSDVLRAQGTDYFNPAVTTPISVAWEQDPSTGSSGVPGWVRPVSSLIVPGTGQLMAGQERGFAYIWLEALLLTRYFVLQSQGDRESDRFHDLAFDVARRPFAPTMRDTAFGYFEEMAKFIASGLFDTNPGSEFVPPTDETTFNGNIWALARRTFFSDPDSAPDPSSLEYQRAVDFYESRAIGPNFTYSWRFSPEGQDAFREAIEDSDDAFAASRRTLGFLLLNHILSAVDAYISERLSRSSGRRTQLRTAVLDPRSTVRRPGFYWAIAVEF